MNERRKKKMDILNREEFIENVIQVVGQLSENKRGCCFAIEGSWGVGKTFVVEEIEKQLALRQSEETKDDRFFVFHYNCWQHDYYDEPAVAIISAMQSTINEDKNLINEKIDSTANAAYKIVRQNLQDIAGLYLENMIGINLIAWYQDISEIREKDKSALKEFNPLFNFTQTIEAVRKKLEEIAKERTIVLVVDELDRCVPQYAIKVMERLHHIFYDLENVVVIMAIDRRQLEHSVEKMFGMSKEISLANIDRYLKKFIDFSMMLDYGTINRSLAEKYFFYFDRFTCSHSSDMKKVDAILSVFLNGIEIRGQEKLIEKANMVHSIICERDKENNIDISVLAFEIMYEVLKLINFKQMKYVVRLREVNYSEIEEILGKERIELLKKMEQEAWHGNTVYIGNSSKGKHTIRFHLYGKIVWYFSNIFNGLQTSDAGMASSEENINRGLNIAKKYCQYSEIIQ